MICSPQGNMRLVWAKQTILCAGGAGQLYRESTNPLVATADGHAMAYRAGAELRDLVGPAPDENRVPGARRGQPRFDRRVGLADPHHEGVGAGDPAPGEGQGEGGHEGNHQGPLMTHRLERATRVRPLSTGRTFGPTAVPRAVPAGRAVALVDAQGRKVFGTRRGTSWGMRWHC